MWLSKRKHDNEDFTLSLPTIPKGVDEISRKRFESFTNWKEKKGSVSNTLLSFIIC